MSSHRKFDVVAGSMDLDSLERAAGLGLEPGVLASGERGVVLTLEKREFRGVGDPGDMDGAMLELGIATVLQAGGEAADTLIEIARNHA